MDLTVMENRDQAARLKVRRVLALVATFLNINGTFLEQRPLWPHVAITSSARVAQTVTQVTKQ